MNHQILYTTLIFTMLSLTGCKTAASQNVQSATPETIANAQIQGAEGAETTATTQTSFLVDDPQEQANADKAEAALLMQQAETALSTTSYTQAFKLAVQSYVKVPDKSASDIAFYAASKLSPIELMRLYEKSTTHLEHAILGQLRLSVCVSQHDADCIQKVQPQTIQALRQIGESERADDIEKMDFSASSQHAPVIAVLLPLSGSDRKIGRAMLGAFIQAAGVYHTNSVPYDLRFFDTRSTPDAIPTLINDIKAANIKLILGPLDIQESLVATQNLDNQVMIGFSPNNAFLKTDKAVFQYAQTLEREIQTIAEFVKNTNAQNVAIIGPEDIYVTTASNLIQTELSNKTVTPLTYPTTQTDLREIAKSAAKSKPDIVFLPTSADAAERIMSFMAQENVWCQKPGTPAPKASSDTRKFTVCVSTSAWAPVAQNHRYKFIQNAIYLDYLDLSKHAENTFAMQFESFYHRVPAVHEILPWKLTEQLKTLSAQSFASPQNLKNAVQNALNHSNAYPMQPNLKIVTSTGSSELQAY